MNDEGAALGISVVMTTYNGSAFIREQMDSILGQTLLPSEIVVVDDCSTDGTFEILEDYAKKYPFVKVCRNDYNLGAHQNFRKAFSLSSCPLVAPSDQDDIWRPDKLLVLRNLLLETDSDLVYSQEEVLMEDGRKVLSVEEMPDIKRLMWGNNLKGHTFLFKREALDVFDEVKNLSFDYALAIKACMSGKYASSKEPLSVWRRHEGCCTTATTTHSELMTSSFSRRKKILYALSHLNKERSTAIETSFTDRGKLLAANPKTKRLSNICVNMSKQTYGSMIHASFINAVACVERGNIKSRVAHFLWAMRQPWIFWYDMHLLHALE